MEYVEYKPHHLLRKYVECYWSALSDKPPFRERESLIPDGTIELMFNFADDYWQVQNGMSEKVKGSHIIGIRKKSLIISQPGKQDFFCIRFKLGGAWPFFRIPVHLFSNGFYSLADLMGKEAKELEEKLYDLEDNQARARLADQYLLKRLQTGMEDYTFVENTIPQVLRKRSIGAMLKQTGTSYKTLERKFNKILGINPSELNKISRFSNAVNAMYSGNFDSLTAIAYEFGYYDQSHFIREFRQLSGYAPREFLKEQFTIVQIIQPALADRLSKLYNL